MTLGVRNLIKSFVVQTISFIKIAPRYPACRDETFAARRQRMSGERL
jgi:hypothetical protein